MVLAVGTGRALRALPKANQPRGGGGVNGQRQKANPQAGMAIFPCAAGLCSSITLRFGTKRATPRPVGLAPNPQLPPHFFHFFFWVDIMWNLQVLAIFSLRPQQQAVPNWVHPAPLRL